MPDEQGYFTDAEKETYRPEKCEVCGSPKRVLSWYEDKKITHMTGGRWSKSRVETCLRPDLHPSR